jgi:hypothetical protein
VIKVNSSLQFNVIPRVRWGIMLTDNSVLRYVSENKTRLLHSSSLVIIIAFIHTCQRYILRGDRKQSEKVNQSLLTSAYNGRNHCFDLK